MATITVHPGDSIQAAIDAASHGDIILVEPAVYSVRNTGIRITKPSLTLRSTEKWGAILDGEHVGDTGFKFLADDCVVDGFWTRALRTKGNAVCGFDLYSAGADSVILNCRASDIGRSATNQSNGQCAVLVESDNLIVDGCYFHDIGRTTDVTHDHGVYADACSGLTIRRTFMERIEHGWAFHAYPGSVQDIVIEDCVFLDGNPGRDFTHFMFDAAVSGIIRNCTFWAPQPGPTLYARNGPLDIDVVDCTSTGNAWTTGGEPGVHIGAGNTLNVPMPRPVPPTAGDPPPDPPPTHATPTLSVGAVTNTAVTLTWPALAGVTGYRFLKDGVQVSTGGAAKTSVKFGSLPPTPVELGVEAVYSDGTTSSSKTTFRAVE